MLENMPMFEMRTYSMKTYSGDVKEIHQYMEELLYWKQKELLADAVHISKLLLDRNVNPRPFLDLVEDIYGYYADAYSIELKLPEIEGESKSIYLLDRRNSHTVFSKYVPVNSIIKFYIDEEKQYEKRNDTENINYVLKIYIDLNF